LGDSVARHVGIVDSVVVRLSLGIEELRVLGVGDFVFPDPVGVIYCAIAGGVSGVVGIAHADVVHRDGGRGRGRKRGTDRTGKLGDQAANGLGARVEWSGVEWSGVEWSGVDFMALMGAWVGGEDGLSMSRIGSAGGGWVGPEKLTGVMSSHFDVPNLHLLLFENEWLVDRVKMEIRLRLLPDVTRGRKSCC